MTPAEIKDSLENMSNDAKAELLIAYGHQLTVMGRGAYEFQGPGVTNPRLLRDINEISHRLYPQIGSLLQGKEPEFPVEVIASWIAGEEHPAVQSASEQAFERALSLCSRNT